MSTISLTPGNDTYVVSSTDETAEPGTMIFSAVVNGLDGNDTISGSSSTSAEDTLNGDAGDDLLIASDHTTAFGGSGNDRLIVRGNVKDYTLLLGEARSDPNDATTVVPVDYLEAPSGQIAVGSDIETVQFQNGQYLAFNDLENYITSAGRGSSGDDTLLAPISGSSFLDGEGGNDTAVLNGNVGDYTLSRDPLRVDDYTGKAIAQDGAFILTAKNGSGTTEISESTETVRFQSGQYLSLADLPAYISGDATFTFGLDNNDILDAALSGNQTITGGAGNDAAYLHGNVGDYTRRDRADGGVTLLSTSGSGTIDIAGDVESVHFQNGQYLALGDVPAFVQAQDVIVGTSGDDRLTAPVAGDTFVDGGAGHDTAVVHGNVADYSLTRLQIASAGEPGSEQGAFVLQSKNGSGNIAVSQATEGVQFQNGQFLSLQDLGSYIAPAPQGAAYTLGGDADDLLTTSTSGDQYLVGNGGSDEALLHGNTRDYTLQAVNLPATAGHPAVNGDELRATNGSGNLFVDHTTESLRFQNGQVLAFGDLPAYVSASPIS